MSRQGYKTVTVLDITSNKRTLALLRVRRYDMYDILVIGSGPAGLSASVYAKRANLNVAVIEKEYEGTGQIAKSGCIDNYLGFQGITGYELGEQFRKHASDFDVEFIEKEAKFIAKSGNGWEITFSDKTKEQAKVVIYAAGAYAKRAEVEGEACFSGKGVSYCAICDGALYKNKKVAVLGGGDTALDDALYLSGLCEKVYLIHRRDEFRGAQKTVALLKSKENVEFVLKDTVLAFRGDKKLESLVLSSGRELQVSGAFVALGSIPNSALASDIVETDENGYIIADENGKSNVPGFFVAGDVRTKELRQVITAVADGAAAATAAANYIRTEGL